MARRALLPLALALLLLLAGCSSTIPGQDTTTPADIEPSVYHRSSTGGQCVEDPMNGFVIESSDTDGERTVSIAANVTVPGTHYEIDDASLTQTGEGEYRLDVDTTESAEKPENACENGGIVHYEVTIRVPATPEFSLQIRHDGRPVSGVASGAET